MLVSACCLRLQPKYLLEMHPDELYRRIFSTLALENLVLSHVFSSPQQGLLAALKHNAEVQ